MPGGKKPHICPKRPSQARRVRQHDTLQLRKLAAYRRQTQENDHRLALVHRVREHRANMQARRKLGLKEARIRPGPSRPFRVSVCAARALNVTGQCRVTLSLQWEHLRAVCGPGQEERGLIFARNYALSQTPRPRRAGRRCTWTAPCP